MNNMGMCVFNPYHSTMPDDFYHPHCSKTKLCPYCQKELDEQNKYGELPKPWANRYERRKQKAMLKRGKIKKYKSVLEKD